MTAAIVRAREMLPRVGVVGRGSRGTDVVGRYIVLYMYVPSIWGQNSLDLELEVGLRASKEERAPNKARNKTPHFLGRSEAQLHPSTPHNTFPICLADERTTRHPHCMKQKCHTQLVIKYLAVGRVM
eukprot:scaffold10205_cov215-Skeletonema_marinoi.AAC.2